MAEEAEEDFYSFSLNELAWLRRQLRDHISLRTVPAVRIFGIPQYTFVQFMGQLRLRTGSSTRGTLYQDQRDMSAQLTHQQVTRANLFFDIIRTWLEWKVTINLRLLVRHLVDIGMQNLASSVQSLLVQYTLPLSTHQLQYTHQGQLIFELPAVTDSIVPPSPSSQVADAAAVPVNDPAFVVANNSLIISHIFSYITDPQSQKRFREASPLFSRVTLQTWRKSSRTKLYSHQNQLVIPGGACTCVRGAKESSCNFSKLLQLTEDEVKQSKKTSQPRHPISSLSVSYRRPRTSSQPSSEYTPLFTNPSEMSYFRNFGGDLVKLSICCSSIGVFFDPATQTELSKLEWLLTRACPNLQELGMNHIIPDSNLPVRPSTSNILLPSFSGSEDAVLPTRDQVLVNFKLNILRLSLRQAPEFVTLLLARSPNLKQLHIHSVDDLEGLLLPTLNGKRIQIEHIEMSDSHHYNFLHEYIVQFPSTLRVLKFHSLDLEFARSTPFDEYACIGRCNNLTRLTINFNVPGRVINPWYFDLSAFQFPRMEELDITFSRHRHRICIATFMRFDFNTLRNLTNLQSLSIQYNGWTVGQRRAVAGFNAAGSADVQQVVDEDYFYRGQRDYYVPENMEPHFPENINAPLLCPNLHKLTFTGWILTHQDVTNFFNWFPSLTHLSIRADTQTLESLPPHSTGLQKLLLQTPRRYSLRHFRAIVERQPEMKIVIKNGIRDDHDVTVYNAIIALQNGRIGFKRAQESDWTF